MEIPLESVLLSAEDRVQDMEPVLCSDRLNDLVEFQMKNNQLNNQSNQQKNKQTLKKLLNNKKSYRFVGFF